MTRVIPGSVCMKQAQAPIIFVMSFGNSVCLLFRIYELIVAQLSVSKLKVYRICSDHIEFVLSCGWFHG